MIKTISALNARHNFGQVMNEVSLKGDEYVIERAGKPLVVMISVDKYDQLQKTREAAKDVFFKVVDKIHKGNRGIKSQVIEKEIEKAVQAVRLAKRQQSATVQTR